MAFLIGGANSAADTGYNIANSYRFQGFGSVEATSSALTLSTASGNNKVGTLSIWTKRSTLGLDAQNDAFFTSSADVNNFSGLRFNSVDQLDWASTDAGSENMRFKTDRVFRDPSAWYHIVLAIDTSESSASDGFKMWVNGVRETSFATSTYTQNATLSFNDASGTMMVGGRQVDTSDYFSGYMADVYWIDGTQYAASDFGETDEDSGIWKPIEASPTFGTNGFFLEFKQTGTSANSSGIGADTSGNNKHFTVANLAAADQCVDTPTNNFCTMTPLGTYPQVVSGTVATTVFSEGNLRCATTDSSGVQWTPFQSTFSATGGKWYYEVKQISGYSGLIGVFGVSHTSRTHEFATYFRTNNGDYYKDTTSASSSSSGIDDNDIVGVAVNMDDEEITWYVNGSAVASDIDFSTNTKKFGDYINILWIGDESIFEMNFGNPPFSISSGNADANGYGNFEFAVPSGYYALCTKNLAEFGG